MVLKMTVEIFVRIVWTVFAKIKNRKMAVFGLILIIFGLILVICFSHSSPTILMPLRTQGPFGCRMTVQNFMKIVWTVFEKIFMTRSGEKKTKKRHDCIFPTPKNQALKLRGFVSQHKILWK